MLDRATGGVMPRLKNDEYLPDGLCVCFNGDRRCPIPEQDWVYLGCEHEHISRSGLCGIHAVMIETHPEQGWRCQICYDKTGAIVTARFIRREHIPDGQAQRAPASAQAPEQGGGL